MERMNLPATGAHSQNEGNGPLFDVRALKDFEQAISADAGIPLDIALAMYNELFTRPRSSKDLADFRESKKPWKKLNDEVSPTLKFLAARNDLSGRIRFPLDNSAPDCWFWPSDSAPPVGIEVTIAQARERWHLMKELNNQGLAPGFLGIPDDAPQAVFDQATGRNRTMYSSAQAITATKLGILSCLAKKDRPVYEGMTLIVQAPLGSISEQRWLPMLEELKPTAAKMPFSEIHLVGGNGELDSKQLQLK